MKSYIIYLTKSYAASTLLAAGLLAQYQNEYENPTVFHGSADEHDFIPQVYYDQDYFFACASFDSDKPTYELHFC